jgi:hypothetical protein
MKKTSLAPITALTCRRIFAHACEAARQNIASALAAIALVACALPSIGCMQPHREFQVPFSCLQFTAASFTGPCHERPDGRIVCDKVVVTATCMQANKSH